MHVFHRPRFDSSIVALTNNSLLCTGLIKGGIPFPHMAVASRRRSIVKTLSYRAIVTVILAVVAFVFTGNLYQTSTIAIVFGILATLTYYLHERLWSKINWR
jgi:uncharacterized membrane protein